MTQQDGFQPGREEVLGGGGAELGGPDFVPGFPPEIAGGKAEGRPTAGGPRQNTPN